MNPVKLIVSNKSALQFKYGKHFQKIGQLLKKITVADKRIGLRTIVVYADEATSCKNAGVRTIKTQSEREYKRIIDDLFRKHVPAYIVLFGAQDVVPFQNLNNPADDEDATVPSDLPYACDAPFSRQVQDFTGPTRVVGRIPDVPGKQDDVQYFTSLIDNIVNHRPYAAEKYHNYFAVSTFDWVKSTELTLQALFGDCKKLVRSPLKNKAVLVRPYTKKHLAPMIHFFNCHGAPIDTNFYGQYKKQFPEALRSEHIPNKITPGTVVAAECCFGAELFDHRRHELDTVSIASNYLAHGAIAFLGSSTVAYGPSDSQSLADLITQYFIKPILQGASTGRALLEARQKFLTESGPDLDPYELKTLAQFYLLGDPSLQPAESEEAESKTQTIGNAIMNNRKKLFAKGITLKNSIGKTSRTKATGNVKLPRNVNQVLKDTGFSTGDRASLYKVVSKKTMDSVMQKKMGGKDVKFRTFVQSDTVKDGPNQYKVLVIKENPGEILGWRTYFSR